MNAPPAPPLSRPDLEQALAREGPSVLLVAPRILRRVIKQHRQIGGLGLQVPHGRSYVLPRDALLGIASRAELGPERPLTDVVILLPRPDASYLANRPAEAVLLEYWRLLFHAHVHVCLEQARALGKLTEAVARERVGRIGTVEFEEAENVLRQDNFLLPPAELLDVYEEFASRYLELRYFDHARLHDHFPSVEDFAAIDRVLADDLDSEALLARTRVPGAALLAPPAGPCEEEEAGPDEAPAPVAAQPDAAIHARLTAQATEAGQRGNQVRAAILRQQALAFAPPGQETATRAEAREELARLAERLQRALHFPPSETEDWARALQALLDKAARGGWSVDARLLYDLQKVCIDRERDLYAVDLIEFFVTWFQRPIQRPLPLQQQVLVVKHLRSAAQRLPAARMEAGAREQLRGLLRSAVSRAEAELRDRLRPLIGEALDRVGLVPGNFAEAQARGKLIEELLDVVVERGFLTIGDLRDALARNRLKLPDLSGPGEFFVGDPLIRGNRRMAEGLDGVYRRGEIYMRWLQRLSSLFFGNRVGRALTLYLLLPLGLAFFTLKGIDGLFEEEAKYLGALNRIAGLVNVEPTSTSSDDVEALLGGQASAPPPEPDEDDFEKWLQDMAAEPAKKEEPEPAKKEEPKPAASNHPPTLVHVFNWYSFAAVSVAALLLLHVPPLRRAVLRGLHYVWLGLRGLFYDLPRAVIEWPPLRRFLQSRPYLIVYQYALKPAFLAAGAAVGLFLLGAGSFWWLSAGGATFVVSCLLINSRLGILIEEWWADSLVRTWHLLSRDLFPGILRFFVWLSHFVLEQVERLLYTVDEWLRFRGGEGRLSFANKLVLGFLWFWVTYVVRFALNLLIEPQVNPVKHFPVVTVSHKLMLLLVKPIAVRVQPTFGWPLLTTEGVVAGFLGLVPGIFGFLAWELKENWKLYRANQSATLDPVTVGSHGEWVIHLLRPGFHSGTIPKLYGKLRRQSGKAARKAEEALHHVEERVRHFVERNLTGPLSASASWGLPGSLAVGGLHLGTHRIRVELSCPALPGEAVWLDFENRGGWLVAGAPRAGWLANLGPAQSAAVADALAGFYKLAGVDLVREQIEGALTESDHYAVLEEGLVLRPATGGMLVYSPNDPDVPPRATDGASAVGAPAAEKLLFRARPIFWDRWVECWEQDQAGKGHGAGLLPGARLLPVPAEPAEGGAGARALT